MWEQHIQTCSCLCQRRGRIFLSTHPVLWKGWRTWRWFRGWGIFRALWGLLCLRRIWTSLVVLRGEHITLVLRPITEEQVASWLKLCCIINEGCKKAKFEGTGPYSQNCTDFVDAVNPRSTENPSSGNKYHFIPSLSFAFVFLMVVVMMMMM